MPKREAIDMRRGDIFIMGGKELVVERTSYAPGKVFLYTKDGQKLTYKNTKKITIK